MLIKAAVFVVAIIYTGVISCFVTFEHDCRIDRGEEYPAQAPGGNVVHFAWSR
jgi:hypothetical protein